MEKNKLVNLYHYFSERMATESNYFWIFVSWSGKLLLLNQCANANFIYLFKGIKDLSYKTWL